MRKGRIVHELPRSAFDARDIVAAAIGLTPGTERPEA
jgi:hypothetical protein